MMEQVQQLQDSAKYRKWVGTLNNWTEAEYQDLLSFFKDAKRYIIGKEGKTEGKTPHLQFFFEKENAVRFGTLKKALPKVHWEQAKGTSLQSYIYCSKEGDFLAFPADKEGWGDKTGERSDIIQAKDILKKGGTMRDVVMEVNSYQAVRMAELYLKYTEEPRNWMPETRWFHGGPGSGKSRASLDAATGLCGANVGYRIYYGGTTGKFLDGYDGQQVVIIDDFRGSDWPLNFLLRLLDRYECRVETKGGSRQFVARYIFITSPYHPEDVYANSENTKQLLRRLAEVREFKTLTHDTEVGGNTEPLPVSDGKLEC